MMGCLTQARVGLTQVPIRRFEVSHMIVPRSKSPPALQVLLRCYARVRFDVGELYAVPSVLRRLNVPNVDRVH